MLCGIAVIWDGLCGFACGFVYAVCLRTFVTLEG